MQYTAADAMNAPNNCASQYTGTLVQSNLRTTAKASVTAGFICAPSTDNKTITGLQYN